MSIYLLYTIRCLGVFKEFFFRSVCFRCKSYLPGNVINFFALQNFDSHKMIGTLPATTAG